MHYLWGHRKIVYLFFYLKNQQNGIDSRLEELLGRQSKIERQMNNIGRSLASLNIAGDESKKVNSMIENTSSLAENVSAKVRRLDEARVSYQIKEKIHLQKYMYINEINLSF